MRFRTQRISGWLILPVVIAVMVASTGTALAAQVPDPSSNLFLQTSGPDAGLGIGDYYSSPAGGDTDHVFVLHVPGDWPAGETVTVSLYDPEIAGPDPSSPAAIDEIRGATDPTTFRLETPSGSVVATRTYSGSATNGVWAHLATFDPGITGTGVFEVHVSSGGDDDNSWRIDASHDPDCAPGGPDGCTGVVDGDESDHAPSGSGALGLGVLRTSYQHGGSGNSCQDHVFYVAPSTPRPLRAHNFDMDGSGSVTYTSPTGVTQPGSISVNGRWNNSADANRVGDVLADVSGWWTAQVCIPSGNQYVFEAPGASPTFPAAQPTPRLIVEKDDGVASAAVGDEVAYSILVENVSNGDPLPDDAYGVVISDDLPSGLSFVSCAAPLGVACSESGGIVTAILGGELAPGASVTTVITARIEPSAPASLVNTAVVSYEDRLGNEMAGESASDTDAVEFTPQLEMSATGSGMSLRGDTVGLTFSVGHAPGSDMSPVSDVALTCGVCTVTGYLSGDDGDGSLQQGETWIYEASADTDAATPDPLVATGMVTGSDGSGAAITVSTTHSVDMVEPGNVAGTVFEDLDGDGFLDPGEPGIDGIGLMLTGSGVASATSVTGDYSFGHLFPGDYAVGVDGTTMAPGLVATNTPGSLSLGEGESAGGIDFGYAYPASISGRIFADADFDGVEGVGEIGMPGVTLTLRNQAGSVVAVSTSAFDGSYSFSVQPGRYDVAIGGGIPHGWAHSGDSVLFDGLAASGESIVLVAVGVANRPPLLIQSAQIVTTGETPSALPATDVEGGTIRFSISEGELPSGLTLGADGTFTGSASISGVYELVLSLCDDGEPTSCADYEWQLAVVIPDSRGLGSTVLPFTGVDVGPLVALGFLLACSGLAVLRRAEAVAGDRVAVAGVDRPLVPTVTSAVSNLRPPSRTR